MDGAIVAAGQQGGSDALNPCNPCVARWGDYSATQVDEAGCIWGATEDIPTGVYDLTNPVGGTPYGTDWGTGIYNVCPATVTPPIAEAPLALALPSLGIITAVGVLGSRRRRRRHTQAA